MPSFAETNRAAFSRPVAPPGYVTPAAAPTWGRAVTPSAAGEVVGPQETGPSMFATVATLAVVGGIFWWVTSGPKMARGNPSGAHFYPRYTVHAKDHDGFHDGYTSAHVELYQAKAAATAAARRGVAQRIYWRETGPYEAPPKYVLIDEYPASRARTNPSDN